MAFDRESATQALHAIHDTGPDVLISACGVFAANLIDAPADNPSGELFEVAEILRRMADVLTGLSSDAT